MGKGDFEGLYLSHSFCQSAYGYSWDPNCKPSNWQKTKGIAESEKEKKDLRGFWFSNTTT